MRKIRNLLLIAVIGSMSCMMGVCAVEYPNYQVGDLVKVTIPNTNESKEFYVIEDLTNINSTDNRLYLVEKEATIKKIAGKDYEKAIEDLNNSSNFYTRLNDVYEADDLFDIWPIDTYDMEEFCNINQNYNWDCALINLSCPSWLGYGFWLDYEEPYYNENGKDSGKMRWAVTMPSLGDDKLKISAWYVEDTKDAVDLVKFDIKFAVIVDKKYVSKVEVEKPKTPATTTSNPKTGITNPLFIGGLSMLGISGLVLLVKKKNLFNRI